MTEVTARDLLRIEQMLGLEQFSTKHYHSMDYSARGLVRKQKVERALRNNLTLLEEYGKRDDVPDDLKPALRRHWRSTRDAHASASYDVEIIKTWLKDNKDDLHK